MPIYPVVCSNEHRAEVPASLAEHEAGIPCPECGALTNSDWSVPRSLHTSVFFQPHFSSTVNSYVNTERELYNKAAAQGTVIRRG